MGSIARAERRRRERSVEKVAQKITKDFPWLDRKAVSIKVNMLETRYQSMLEEDAAHLQEVTIDHSVRELYKAENYMSVGMLLISLQAIRMAFGDLKTLPARIDKFMQNLTPAMEYVDNKGIRETLAEMQGLYGLGDLELEDEDFSIDAFFDTAKRAQDVVWEVWRKRRPELAKLEQDVNSAITETTP